MDGWSWVAFERMLGPLARLRFTEHGIPLWQLLGLLLALLGSYVAARALTRGVVGLARRLAKQTDTRWDDELVVALPEPLRLASTSALLWCASSLLRLPVWWDSLFDKLIVVALVVSGAWLLSRAVASLARLFEQHLLEQCGDDLEAAQRARRRTTQLEGLRRLFNLALLFLSVSLSLMQFDIVRSVGVSLLASAGVAGIVVGVAAQRSLASVLAGLQFSLTQPVRMGDTVVVEGEWGTVEELTLTYVVVAIWDKRRLIVPVSRFLEQPVYNWTRAATTELLGTVLVHADPSVPVEDARAELERILADTPLWDGASKGLVVTDVNAHSVELRATVSARDGGALWDLRCHVRERLLRWLQSAEGGRYLPRSRVLLEGHGA